MGPFIIYLQDIQGHLLFIYKTYQDVQLFHLTFLSQLMVLSSLQTTKTSTRSPDDKCLS